MTRWLALALLLIPAAAIAANWAQFMAHSGGGDVPFVPLHTYFIAATGCSDANNGTSTATPWCTPNHPVVCGDVVLVKPGSYTSGFINFGTVSNCPSSIQGIDGAGQIYFAVLLCAASDLSSTTGCLVTGGGGFAGTYAINISVSNWSAQGFVVPGTGVSQRGLQADGSASLVHHIAFVNNLVYNTGVGIVAGDDGSSHTVPATIGPDYFASVGNLTQNSEQDTICTAATVVVAPGLIDSIAGTHFYFYGGFSYYQPSNGCSIDEENFMFDTWDAHGVTNQTVAQNNMGWNAFRYGIQVFTQNINPTVVHQYVLNNTFYNNNTGNNALVSDINIQMDNASAGFVTVQNNISQNTANQGYALLLGGASGPTSLANIILGGTGNENILKGTATSCPATCDAGNNQIAFNGAGIGTNLYQTPLFSNTADLLANWTNTTPNCAGFQNITQCMGWNAATGTLTSLTPISDLTAGCAGCGGKGYQKPSVICAANAFYPTWLKGIVYLHADSGWTNGTTITEKAGLVTKPCGL